MHFFNNTDLFEGARKTGSVGVESNRGKDFLGGMALLSLASKRLLRKLGLNSSPKTIP